MTDAARTAGDDDLLALKVFHGTFPRIRSAARSATALTGILLLPAITVGMTEASTTRSASMPLTRSDASTTSPMRQVPQAWCTVTSELRICASICARPCTCGPGDSLLAGERRECWRRKKRARDLKAAHQHIDVTGCAEEIEVNRRPGVRVVAGQCDAAAAGWPQVHEDDAVAMTARQPVAVGIAMRRHEDDLQIGAIDPGPRAHEAIGLEHIARQRSGAQQQVLRGDEHAARHGAPRQTIGFGIGRAHGKRRGRVIVQIAAHRRQVEERRDAQCLKCRGIAYAGELQQLRRAVGAAGDDDLAPGAARCCARRPARSRRRSRAAPRTTPG